MKRTLFLSRIAWILNGCFLLSLLLRLTDMGRIPPDLTGTLVIAGWVLSPLMNACVFFMALTRIRDRSAILLGRFYIVYLIALVLQLLFITRLI